MKLSAKIYCLSTIFIVMCSTLFAQTVTGKVINEFQQPLQNANIVNTTTEGHIHSNEKGEFTLEDVSIGDTLLISFVGYQSELVKIESVTQSLTVILYAKTISLEEITIAPQINALQVITEIDIQTHPVNSSQDVLRKVPGLFIGQHAGGGKAEQIFLRGFDIDHGTDITISVDGLPVNMVSHAHGQGYADLHFIIPETIEKIDFGKGPYAQDQGNFSTAGYVEFVTRKKLDRSSIKLEGGQFDTYRVLGMFDLIHNNNHSAYVATEFLSTDGYFDSPQNFNRTNLFGKYSGKLTNTDYLGVTISHFDSKWDASGQIPQRAVDSGLITRFGAIDDTEGGNTSRNNILINHDKIIDSTATLKSKLYLSQYDFELYSNFTFFLEDPINGDQIRQKENRLIYGLGSEYEKQFELGEIDGSWQAGISLRNDEVNDNELSRTANRRETLEQLQLGDVNETNLGAYAGTTFNKDKWTFNPSVRVDYFDFQYVDKLAATFETQEQNKAIVSPKFNVLYNSSRDLQLYLKTGKSFHSNDTRVVVAQQGEEILPAAYGFDVGYIWKPTSKMFLNMAFWYLYLEQEFVYVGDAGVVEPSGQTKRQGIELSYRYQPVPWLYLNLDTNYTFARAIDEPDGQDFIPLAPDFTLVGSVNLLFKSGFYGNLNLRHIGNRPANEDDSLTAVGYTVTDLNAGYKWRNMSFGVQIQNVFDTEWNETQFATLTQLQNETQPVEEITFTPGTPFNFRAMIQYNF